MLNEVRIDNNDAFYQTKINENRTYKRKTFAKFKKQTLTEIADNLTILRVFVIFF